ncbi:type IV pilus modification PilV family protein [Schnuerera ultunensis]|uniref:type IV pilus modification PilV family protein n=1 Tax=Schnuerera ultunensis TaxID=45497 RepID=UPI000405D6D5|nr:prepilin-type N-terminal cleavage/methylation domain-containing protein [Schnuerera ultunensis]
MVKINDKGLTLLEVLITLAILAVITVSFFSLFTTTNLNINFSSRKVESVREGKSILDEINSEVTDAQIENDQDFKGIVEEILNKKGYHNNYKIFDNDNDFFKYENKKIHCLIERQNIYIESTDNSSIRSNVQKIKIILFYDKGKKNVQLSTYVPIKEDRNV